MPSDPIYEYLRTPPDRIDGEPHEVAAKATTQLGDILAWVGGSAKATQKQVRNAFQTQVLNAAPATTPADLAERWEQSDEKAGIDRIITLIGAAERATRTL